jgi:DNA repair protein RadC
MIVNKSEKAFELLRGKINLFQEEVWTISLSADLELLYMDMVFRGTVDQCAVHPRDLIRIVCGRNAAAFILAHNHPSGRTQPSLEDKKVTRKIMQIANLLEIPMKDHLIVAAGSYYSFADEGLLNVARRR